MLYCGTSVFLISSEMEKIELLLTSKTILLKTDISIGSGKGGGQGTHGPS